MMCLMSQVYEHLYFNPSPVAPRFGPSLVRWSEGFLLRSRAGSGVHRQLVDDTKPANNVARNTKIDRRMMHLTQNTLKFCHTLCFGEIAYSE
jgi:hypothetical protein